jgi:UDP-2,4-diacetamido-2,4,6-trideoxy-beta-L-altropyranose hydrolase
MNKNLIIRADANTCIGTGHVMRCIALAQAWQGQGGDATFLSHCDSKALHQRIIDEGFDFIPIEKPHPHSNDLHSTLELLSAIGHQPSTKSPWLALDGYHFTPDYQKAIRENGYKLLVIDDMAHLDHYHADILLNQNIHASRLHYSCDMDTVKLLGCEYVLLRREFLKYKDWKREIPDKAKKILVTMGGSDPDNVTLKVIRALNSLNFTDFDVRIVVGPANPNIKSLENELHLSPFIFHLLHGVGNMPELMAWADMAVSAGGSTCWEMCFMGLPTILIVTADNQEGIVARLDEMGLGNSLGWFSEVSGLNISRSLNCICQDHRMREMMSLKGNKLIDGNGTSRVINVMKDLAN